MRTKTITKTIYKFDELSDKAQDNALCRLSELDYEWWDSVYDDAKNIGLDITEFDLDRRRYIKGKLLQSPLAVIEKIKADHGESCDTHKTACQFEQCFRDYAEAINFDNAHSDDDDFQARFCEADYDDSKTEFLQAILEDYSIMLQKEYDYLTSREAIIENIEANGYEFDEQGNLA